jgi:hypothetical protein
MGLIRKIKTLSLELLSGLMALTSNKHNILQLGLSNGTHNGGSPVSNDLN